MGSVAAADVTIPDAVVPKIEPGHDDYTSESDSLPEQDERRETSGEQASQGPAPVLKRKGGRKPIYATSEERKQRNRQAQAAFRERRTEYIKQLETTIQQHEENLQNLQQSHRTAADECLMLRYKNSLLERILLEKGIDVQAELALKGSPHLRPVQRPSVAGQASPMQKAMLNRHQHIKHRPALAQPIQTPTPPSQHSSPSTARSPGFALQGGMSSPQSDLSAQQTQQHSQRPMPQAQHHSFPPQLKPQQRNTSACSDPPQYAQPLRGQSLLNPLAQNTYYPASFQKHYDQLDQEYDAQADMLDELDAEDADTDSFIPNFQLPPTTSGPPMGLQASPPVTTSVTSDGGGAHNYIDPYDPMLDADPFGLTASMHFPNPFTYPPHPPRR